MDDARRATIALDYPLGPDELGPGARTITEVTLRAADVETIEAMEDAGVTEAEGDLTVRQTRVILVAMSDLTTAEALRLDPRDFRRISEAAVPFLEAAGASLLALERAERDALLSQVARELNVSWLEARRTPCDLLIRMIDQAGGRVAPRANERNEEVAVGTLTSSLIVRLVDRASGPARSVSRALGGITRAGNEAGRRRPGRTACAAPWRATRPPCRALAARWSTRWGASSRSRPRSAGR